MSLETTLAICAACVLVLLGWRAGRNLGSNRHGTSLLFSLVVVFSLVVAWSLSGRLWWSNVLPFSEVIFWANCMPAMLALAAGLATLAPGLHQWRRPLTVGFLLCLSFGFLVSPVARPLLAPTGVTDQQAVGWRQNVCLQSHEASCGAAAAATLLSRHDIQVNEARMVRECLTSAMGTEPLGLYRGLSLVCRQTSLRPSAASANPQVWQDRGQLPNLSIVKLDRVGRRGSTRWIGSRQERHAVVVFGRDASGDWLIGDPAIGLTRWNDRLFQQRFTGEAIFLKDKH